MPEGRTWLSPVAILRQDTVAQPGAQQGMGRQFAERAAVVAGKMAEIAKAAFRADLGHGCPRAGLRQHVVGVHETDALQKFSDRGPPQRKVLLYAAQADAVLAGNFGDDKR